MSSSTAAPALDLTGAAAALAADLCQQLPELAHIDPGTVLFCLARSRATGVHGVYARIAPLRFAGGVREETRQRGWRRRTYRMPSLEHNGREILYLIYLLVPRFLRLSPQQRLATLVHELYHISERCDGDIRRFPGRNYAHGSSRLRYNRTIDTLVERYLASAPAPALLAPLALDADAWQSGQVRLTGFSVPLPRPRLIAARPSVRRNAPTKLRTCSLPETTLIATDSGSLPSNHQPLSVPTPEQRRPAMGQSPKRRGLRTS